MIIVIIGDIARLNRCLNIISVTHFCQRNA